MALLPAEHQRLKHQAQQRKLSNKQEQKKAVASALKDYASQNGFGDIYNIPERTVISLIIGTVQDDNERDRILRKYKISDEAINDFMRAWGSR